MKSFLLISLFILLFGNNVEILFKGKDKRNGLVMFKRTVKIFLLLLLLIQKKKNNRNWLNGIFIEMSNVNPDWKGVLREQTFV